MNRDSEAYIDIKITLVGGVTPQDKISPTIHILLQYALQG